MEAGSPRPGPISRRLDRSGPGVGRGPDPVARLAEQPGRQRVHARNVTGEAPTRARCMLHGHGRAERPRSLNACKSHHQRRQVNMGGTQRQSWAVRACAMPVCRASSSCLRHYAHAPAPLYSAAGLPPGPGQASPPTGRARVHKRVHVQLRATALELDRSGSAKTFRTRTRTRCLTVEYSSYPMANAKLCVSPLSV